MLNVWSLSMVTLVLRVFNDDRVLPHQPPDTAMTDIYPDLFQLLRRPSHRWTRISAACNGAPEPHKSSVFTTARH